MNLEQLRDKLLKLRKGSAFKASPLKIIDIDTGDTFLIESVVFSSLEEGTTYIKVKKETTNAGTYEPPERSSVIPR